MGAPLSNNDEDSDIASIADINITPFVDVVLVLLVIFIVTAPTLMKDRLNIELPKTSQSDGKASVSLGIAINRQNQVLLNGIPVSLEQLKAEVQKEVAANRDIQAVISADIEVKHGEVVSVIDTVKSAGLNKFALQVEQKK